MMRMRLRKMELKLIFLRTARDLPPAQKVALRRIAQKHARKAAEVLGVNNFLNLTVYPNQRDVIPETGELGYAQGGDWIRLTIDPTRKKSEIQKIILDIIPATIYHEMHHIARQQRRVSARWRWTLLEAIVSEGLATIFAEEQWPKFRAPRVHIMSGC